MLVGKEIYVPETPFFNFYACQVVKLCDRGSGIDIEKIHHLCKLLRSFQQSIKQCLLTVRFSFLSLRNLPRAYATSFDRHMLTSHCSQAYPGNTGLHNEKGVRLIGYPNQCSFVKQRSLLFHSSCTLNPYLFDHSTLFVQRRNHCMKRKTETFSDYCSIKLD